VTSNSRTPRAAHLPKVRKGKLDTPPTTLEALGTPHENPEVGRPVIELEGSARRLNPPGTIGVSSPQGLTSLGQREREIEA